MKINVLILMLVAAGGAFAQLSIGVRIGATFMKFPEIGYWDNQ